MAQIEFNSTEGNKSGGGWEPLPDGQYTLQIDNIESTVSKKSKPQLKISCHVVDGPHANEKCTLWYSLVPEAGWRLEILLNATLNENEYEQLDTGETRTNKKTGEDEPIYTFRFDTDSMIGAQIPVNCKQREYEGKTNNDFEIIQVDEDATPAAAPAPAPKTAPKAAAKPAAAAATATASTVPTQNAPRRRMAQ